MQASVDILVQLVPPPSSPNYARGDWKSVEAEMNIELPSDYKLLIECYGYGQFCNALSVLNPFVTGSMRSEAVGIIQQIQQVSDLSPEEYSFFPDPTGLIPCLSNVNGCYVFWRPIGITSDWELIVWDSDTSSLIRAEESPLCLLCRILQLIS